MQADHRFRARGGRGDLVEVQRRGVGGQDGAGLADAVQAAKDVLLHVHVLEHGLDHQVHVGEVLQVERAAQQRHALLDGLRRQAALLGGVLVVGADGLEATVQGFLAGLDDVHRNAHVQEVHGDACAHGAGTDHAHRLHRQHGRVLGQARHVPGLARGEEVVALRGRLVALHEFHEVLALKLQAFVDGQVHRRLDALDDLLRCLEATELLGVGLAELGEDLRVATGGLDLLVLVADLAQRALLVHHAAGQGHGGAAQVVFGRQLVEQAALQRVLGAHMGARGHHLQGGFRPDDARQALGATGPRQQADVHLGQAQARRGHGNAVVADQRHFKATAQGGAMDGGHHRLGRLFQDALHLAQAHPGRRLAELGDVGTGDEGAALAAQHHRVNGGVGDGGLHGAVDAVAHRGRQGIDRREVDGDHANAIDVGEGGHVVDRLHENTPGGGSENFEQTGRAHATAHAHGHHAVLRATALAFDEHVAGHARTRHAEGVANGDRAA